MFKKNINLYIFHRYPVAKQFIQFCLVGLTNFVVNIFVYWFLTRIFNFYYIAAGFGSFLVSVTWSFYMNRYWTFKHKDCGEKNIHTQYVKFFIINILGMIINLILLYVMVDIFIWYDLLSMFIGSVLVSVATFSLSRFWVFKNNFIKKETEEVSSNL
jgi:putative flippase GtrA